MNEGKKILEEVVKELEKKKSRKARKQLENVKQYIEDHNIKFNKQTLKIEKKKIKHYITLNYEDLITLSPIYRYIDDNEIILDKNPIMIVVKFQEKGLIESLKALESLDVHCLIYDFVYKYQKHNLILSCDNCYYGYTENNKFCETMIKKIWDLKLNFEPKIYNKYWI